MKFAFKSMTRGENAAYIGMVYGMEVVPWVHNTAFQVAAKLGEENIEIPMSRSLIPRAYPELSTHTDKWEFKDRDKWTCKEPTFNIDKYGYCCELEQMFDVDANAYTGGADLDKSMCKPIRALDPSLVKDNMVNNGEFVSRMDSAMRYKLAWKNVFPLLILSQKIMNTSNSHPKRLSSMTRLFQPQSLS